MAQRHWAQGTLVSFLLLRTAAGLLRMSVADNSFESGVVSSFSPWSVRPSSKAWVFPNSRTATRENCGNETVSLVHLFCSPILHV